VTGTTLQVTGPALCLLLRNPPRPAGMAGAAGVDSGRLVGGGTGGGGAAAQAPSPRRGALQLVVVVGVALTVLIFAQTVYSIGTTDYAAGDFWCEVVG
jgi:hypothetical protein